MSEQIEKKSGDFRGIHRCNKLRSMDGFNLQTAKGQQFDNAIIAKEILNGYFDGKYQISEFDDLVSQGIEDDFLTTKTGELRKERLVKCLARAAQCEKRSSIVGTKQIIKIGPYNVSVKPDRIFRTATSIELVIYRTGKPNVSMKGRKEDVGVNQCIELYLLLLYGRNLLQPGEMKEIKASYYFLRKNTDNKQWNSDFFDATGGNIVYLEEVYTGGSNLETDYDKSFKTQIQEFIKGGECTEEDCKNCQYKMLCNYQKAPEPYEKKTLVSKKGTIIPSPAQQEIIDFRSGVCRVNATAGAGKTECMTERGARMIAEGVNPESILFITFTDAGAIEMKERIIKKLATRNLVIDADKINAMTFNTFAFRIVKEQFQVCGFSKQPAVIDEVRNSVIITQMLEETPVVGLDYLNFKVNQPNCKGALACASRIFDTIKSKNLDVSDKKTAFQELSTFLKKKGEYYRFYNDTALMQLIDLYVEYNKRLKEDCLVQFSDQEPLMNYVLSVYPDYLNKYGYHHIIVDEFQDSNDVQLDTIKKLTQCPSFESLMVVGDDSQSIYGFRNTSPENILHFFEKLGLPGKDLYLTDNRRSTPEILELANKINNLNTEKVDKDMNATREHGYKPIVAGFFNKQAEYDYIANEIHRQIKNGVVPEDIAFIAAKKTELVAMAAELSKRKIPWVMKNPMPLMENSRVQAALSIADAFYQPDAEDLYFNYLIAKYDGEIFTQHNKKDIETEIHLMKRQFQSMDMLQIGYQRILFHRLLDAIKGTDEIYQYFLDLVYANEDLQSELQYIQNFKQFGESTSKKMEQNYAGVVLTTAHSSKGLEWPIVFNSISNYDAQYLHNGKKSLKDIEEKRRLLFVSMTRARDLLYVTGQYVAYGKKGEYVYNQFLREVYEASGLAYNPIDPMDGLTDNETEGRKTKAILPNMPPAM